MAMLDAPNIKRIYVKASYSDVSGKLNSIIKDEVIKQRGVRRRESDK